MNAIITAAIGYTDEDLLPFLCSVQQNCRESKVFLIAYKEDRERIDNLRKKYLFLEPIYTQRKGTVIGNTIWAKLLRVYLRWNYYWIAYLLSKRDFASILPLFESLGRLSLHIALERYFIALQVVRAYGSSWSNVLLTDSRDVVIQSDPFISIDGRLISGIEKIKIKDCQTNSGWIKHLYGEEVVKKMSDQQVVCSGVTLGPVEFIERYLSEMCNEIWSLLPKITFSGGFDQGIHNHLCFENKLLIYLTDNREGLIATLGFEKNMHKDAVRGLVQVDGSYPAIVHQYDRYPDIQDFIKENYVLSVSKN